MVLARTGSVHNTYALFTGVLQYSKPQNPVNEIGFSEKMQHHFSMCEIAV